MFAVKKFSELMLTCIAALAIVVPTAGATERKLKPGIIGEDDREPVGDFPGPWTAIGHINVSGYRSLERCTGTRIAPGLVLTSAHCVVNIPRKKLHPAKDIHFLAGVDHEKNVGHSIARCVILPDDFAVDDDTRAEPDTNTSILSQRFLGRDLAMIVLNEDTVKADVIGIDTVMLPPGAKIISAGYPADRRHVLTLHNACKVTGVIDGLLITDCDTVAGSSGGPILVEKNGEWKIAALMGAVAPGKGNIAVSLANWTGIAEAKYCAE
jgi:protease YdgD